MSVYALIPAAGSGLRAGFGKNKILLKTGGETVLAKTVRAFASCPGIARIVVAVNPRDLGEVEAALSPFPTAVLTEGGDTRTQSVRRMLEYCARENEPPRTVLIHDAARPFVSGRLIETCIRETERFGSAVCAVPQTDTAVFVSEDGTVEKFADRGALRCVQTPQGFAFPAILAAYRNVREDDSFTDDAGVYAAYIAPPHLCAGDPSNRKLTYREDFMNTVYRTGTGADTHAFGKKTDHIILGGARIPHTSGLVAHSDGDVLVHAVMDALLSAAGLPDIGTYFPDADPALKGISSLELLSRTVRLVADEGFAPVNVSAAVLAQRPKLAPHIAEMKKNLSNVLGIPAGAVGITAGTTERLGFIGRGEGISVIATVLLRGVQE